MQAIHPMIRFLIGGSVLVPLTVLTLKALPERPVPPEVKAMYDRALAVKQCLRELPGS